MFFVNGKKMQRVPGHRGTHLTMRCGMSIVETDRALVGLPEVSLVWPPNEAAELARLRPGFLRFFSRRRATAGMAESMLSRVKTAFPLVSVCLREFLPT